MDFTYFITVNKYRFCISVIGYINVQIIGIGYKKINIGRSLLLCTNILNWPLNTHKKIKPYLAKTLTEPLDLIWQCWALQMQTLHATIRGSNWQRSDPMAYRHYKNESTLAQWCWGIQWGWQSYFRVSVPLLITTLFKCSGSMCAGGAVGDGLAWLSLETVLTVCIHTTTGLLDTYCKET